MKQYVIDELRYQDFEAIAAHLDDVYGSEPVEGVYSIPLNSDLLTPEQKRHVDCLPLYVAVELSETSLVCEFLVRTRNRIRCSCMGYATNAQRVWIMQTVDGILEKLKISI